MDQTPRWIGYCNVKGGAGKSTTAFACALAAAQLGHRVVVVDMDPSGWLSTALGVLGHPVGVAQVLNGRAQVAQSIVISGLGVAVLVGSEDLYHVGFSRPAIRALRAELDPLFDTVIVDTHPGENMIPAVMSECDRICLPLPLDRASAIVSTDTLKVAERAGALDRIGGLLPSLVKLRKGEPEDTEGREVYGNMRLLGIAYDTWLPISKQWSRATSLAELPPPRLIQSVAIPLFQEIQARRADPARLKIWMHAYSKERRAEELREAREAAS